MRIDPIQLSNILSARLLTVDDAEAHTGVSRFTWLDILGRRDRRDEDGLVHIEPETAQAIKKLLEISPLFTVTRPRQWPPVRRKVSIDATFTPEEQIANFHRAREAAKKPKSP